MSRASQPGLREAIIATSLELGSQLGEEGLTMRGIAARLGVSATALYQYFESKNAILIEIRMYGIDLLQQALAPAMKAGTPMVCLTELHRRYITFARANPWLYTVLMINDQLDWNELSEADLARTLRPLHMAHEILERGRACGEFRTNLDVESTSFQMWAAVHGLCSLVISGRITEEHPAFPVKDEKGFIESFVGSLVRSCADG